MDRSASPSSVKRCSRSSGRWFSGTGRAGEPLARRHRHVAAAGDADHERRPDRRAQALLARRQGRSSAAAGACRAADRSSRRRGSSGGASPSAIRRRRQGASPAPARPRRRSRRPRRWRRRARRSGRAGPCRDAAGRPQPVDGGLGAAAVQVPERARARIVRPSARESSRARAGPWLRPESRSSRSSAAPRPGRRKRTNGHRLAKTARPNRPTPIIRAVGENRATARARRRRRTRSATASGPHSAGQTRSHHRASRARPTRPSSRRIGWDGSPGAGAPRQDARSRSCVTNSLEHTITRIAAPSGTVAWPAGPATGKSAQAGGTSHRPAQIGKKRAICRDR